MRSEENIERYVAQFRQRQQAGGNNGASWFNPVRDAAMAQFERLGFPTTRDEDWKYTNLEPIVSSAFTLAGGPAKLSSHDLLARTFADVTAPRIVFVDGFYAPDLSALSDLPVGVRVESLARAVEHRDQVLQAHWERSTSQTDDSLFALNTALTTDGALIKIDRGRRIEQPLQLLFVMSGRQPSTAAYVRNVIICESGSEVKIVESYSGVARYLMSAVTEISTSDGAIVDHYRLQRDSSEAFNIGQLNVDVRRDAHFTAHALTLGGALIRNDVRVTLNGEGAECALNGLYLLDGKQHVDNHTEIEHARPRARSLELYKGILSGAAHAVFNGKIIVDKDAQKTDARQTNKNLLLSADAVVNTKPQLEIYADDVKCSHGSTIGRLDPDALFYLRSRGLGADEAQSVLSYAFASDVVNRVKIASMREHLNEYLLQLFGRSAG